MLNMCRRITDMSSPSRATVRIMDFLMGKCALSNTAQCAAEVEERRRPPGVLGKRKSDLSDAFKPDDKDDLQDAVQKLIRQAALEADSDVSPISNATPSSDARMSPHADRHVLGAYAFPGRSASFSSSVQRSPQLPPVSTSANFSLFNTTGTGFDTISPYTTNPTFAFGGASTAPQLDPAVEAILAPYFPGSQSAIASPSNQLDGMNPVPVTPAAANGPPDDFLSKVFSFSWETAPNGGTSPSAQIHQAFGIEGWNANGWMG